MYRVYLFPLSCSGDIRDYETVEEVVHEATSIADRLCIYQSNGRYYFEGENYQDFETLAEATDYAEAYTLAPIRVNMYKYYLYPKFHFQCAMVVTDVADDKTFAVVDEYAPEAALKYVIKQYLGRDEQKDG